MSKVEIWRDGDQIHGSDQPQKQTSDEIFEEFKMRIKPHQCPPILLSDSRNAINEFLHWAPHLISQNTGQTVSSADTEVLASLAVFSGLMNVAAHVSSALGNAGGEIAESLDRLARAVENSSPAVDPPKLTRLRDVSRRIGISSEAIMRLAAKNEFPQPATRLEGIPFFRESDVTVWLTAKAE
jgi:predicted DNA-binding transcriptional regulator AlpA